MAKKEVTIIKFDDVASDALVLIFLKKSCFMGLMIQELQIQPVENAYDD